MTKIVWKIMCEWDIGCGNIVFEDHCDAEDFAKENLRSCGIDESVEDLKSDGLLCFEPLNLYRSTTGTTDE